MENKLVKIEGKSFQRDIDNMALVESDIRVKNEYLSKKKLLLDNKKMKEQLNNLTNELEEIKRMIKGT